MSDIFVFDTINVDVPVSKIYKRMGFFAGKTILSAQRKKSIDAFIDQALSLIELRGAACRKTILNNNLIEIKLYENISIKSKHVSSWLAGCGEVLIMAVTSGHKIMKAISRDAAGINITRGVVFDAVASEVTDAGLDWLMRFFKQQLRRENKILNPKRFSPGFGDFALSSQRIIYDILELHRLNIELTSSCILIPEKSVTAFAGIK